MKNMFLKIYGLMVLLISSVSLYGSNVVAEIEYFYSDDGTIIGKAFNGKRVNFEYDLRGQLLAVKDASGNDLERYTYDPAGNRLSKTINGVTTTYSYDEANQLIRSTVNGEITYYEYDAAGRMIQAGDKSYIYNGNNKVIEVRQNGETIAKFEYNIDGQIAKAIYGDKKEEFIWDGLALIWRSGVTYINEPYVTGGNPVMAGDDVLFNDMLGSTLAVNDKAVEMTSFGETDNENAFFTGKPMIDELGYSFLFRDYNPNQGKWTTVDPLGYPDGWNNLAYCNNGVTSAVDLWGCATATQDEFGNIFPSVGIGEAIKPYHEGVPGYNDIIEDIISLIDGDTVTFKKQRLEIYSRSKHCQSVTRGPLLLMDGRKVLFIDTTTLYEKWELWSFELTVTRETVLSTLLRKMNEGATITSVACLLTMVGGKVAGATTIAAAIALLEKETQERYSIQDRLLILTDQHLSTVTKTIVE